MSAYLLEATETEESEEAQRSEETTFVGGYPRLPAKVELPHCACCGALQTFFFQIAFPSDHIWAGYTLALFHCTACEYDDDGELVPTLFKREEEPLDIPAHFFESYQINFRIFVFPTEQGQMRRDYEPRILFRHWNLRPVADNYPENTKEKNSVYISKVGGEPWWIQFDNTPATYAGSVPMHFLVQVVPRFTFDIVPDAPPQVFTDSIYEELRFDRYYKLFLHSGFYFFGTTEPNQDIVYIVLQH